MKINPITGGQDDIYRLDPTYPFYPLSVKDAKKTANILRVKNVDPPLRVRQDDGILARTGVYQPWDPLRGFPKPGRLC